MSRFVVRFYRVGSVFMSQVGVPFASEAEARAYMEDKFKSGWLNHDGAYEVVDHAAELAARPEGTCGNCGETKKLTDGNCSECWTYIQSEIDLARGK